MSEAVASAAARVISLAKAARRKLRVVKPKPKPPEYEAGSYFSRCPALAAFMRHAGRDKRGQVRWVLTDGELRYLVAVGAFTNRDGFCKASQIKLAAELGVGRRLVGRWEAGLIAKGLAEAIPISRHRGRWGFRILRLIYPQRPPQVGQDSQDGDGGYLPPLKGEVRTSEAPSPNETKEPLRGAR